MDDPKQNVYASATPGTESKPIQGRPAGRASHPESSQPPAQNEVIPSSENSAESGDQTALGTATINSQYHGKSNGIPSNGDGNGASEISANGETSDKWAPYETAAAIAVAEPVVEQPAVEPVTEEVTEKADTRPAWRKIVSTIIGTRWVLVIPAVILAIYAEQLTEQARNGVFRLTAPPLLSWQLFVVAGLLLALATFPGKALLPSGRSAFWRGVAGMKKTPRFIFFGCLGGSSNLHRGRATSLLADRQGSQRGPGSRCRAKQCHKHRFLDSLYRLSAAIRAGFRDLGAQCHAARRGHGR